MITATQLGFSFPGQDPVLEGVDFHLPAGLTLGLVGTNGSGKSTLLSILAGLFTPTRGEVQVGPYFSPGGESEIRRVTGLVLQDADLQILGSTVAEDLCLGFEPDDSEGVRKARALAERFAIAAYWDSPVQVLSWGQKRKLCISATLLQDPDILLLDEPFSGLDYPGILEMRQNLEDNKRLGMNQIVAAHDLEPLADIADLWAILHGKELKLFGEAAEVFDRLREFGVRPPCSWQAGLGVKAWDWEQEH